MMGSHDLVNHKKIVVAQNGYQKGAKSILKVAKRPFFSEMKAKINSLMVHAHLLKFGFVIFNKEEST